jgi:hypothetical protein
VLRAFPAESAVGSGTRLALTRWFSAPHAAARQPKFHHARQMAGKSLIMRGKRVCSATLLGFA